MVDFQLEDNAHNNQENVNHVIDVAIRGSVANINGVEYHIDKLHSANTREMQLVNKTLFTYIRYVIADLKSQGLEITDENLLETSFALLPFYLESNAGFKADVELLLVLLTKQKKKHIESLSEDDLIDLIVYACRVNHDFLLPRAVKTLEKLFKTAQKYLTQRNLESPNQD